MTREKEIINAATEARMASAETLTPRGTHISIDDVPFVDKIITCDEVAENAFIKGAKWADKHPVNVWHNASEEPKEDMDILCISKNGKVYKVSKIGNPLYNWLKDNDGIKKWAYISDLLPKE